MNVRTLCLSILYEGEATGYDIRRLSVDGEFAYFVEASFGSIYPALAKLEQEGLVTSRTVPQPGKPARKIYSITDAGRAEFAEELLGPLGDDVYRSPFLLLARFARILPKELVEQRANEHLKRLSESRQKLDDVSTNDGCTAADRWVINYGRSVLDVAETYLRTHMHELTELAKADPRKDAAE
ncbi:PadR family transcriptional regulator [Devosia sp. SD17-2]|jgi:PadR family transcriptional regulator AphA|uniref:PadR family transcriptional regulator n=1 Tax=Devosia sp. SD17-2 TaxID=2976459 RepID=UPI0023D7FDFA|nr:PadR family transcriptional regulator [Devosia sp. SD17-2]WEJ32304.1 PadR family transcriptional regulator [Devosia sp. SD17-2]